jgi:hypothetical protein
LLKSIWGDRLVKRITTRASWKCFSTAFCIVNCD